MLKHTFLLLSILFSLNAAYSQSADTVYDQYLDFNLARLKGEQDKLLELGEKVLSNADKLPEKARISFYFSIGKVYEDNNDLSRAAVYFEKVAAAVPNYYVAQRGLGYIYLNDVKAIEKKLNAAKTDIKTNQQLFADYIAAAKKALPHLEKAQACDPSDETMAIIKSLYKSMKDVKGIETLDDRLKQLSSNCIDILDDH